MSSAIEKASRKYSAFCEMLENCDSDIFIAIPGLAILKNLIHASEDEKTICHRFLPHMLTEGEETNRKYQELKSEYLKLKTRVCGGSDFIIRCGSGSASRQRSQSRDATAMIPNGTKATIASSLICNQQGIIQSV